MSDLSLLGLEMDVLWGTDAYGRDEPAPLVAVAAASDGCAVRISSSVPPALAAQVRLDESVLSGTGDPSRRPPELDRWAELLAPVVPVTVSEGPSYLVKSPRSVSGVGQMHTSAQMVPAMLAAARPQAWWQPQEWEELLTGRLGPWAIAMDGSHVVALCHTPRSRHGSAEAGVWTHPDARRRGHAAAVTAAWADVAGEGSRRALLQHLRAQPRFPGVARRLGLRPLGWIWRVHPTAEPAADDPQLRPPAG